MSAIQLFEFRPDELLSDNKFCRFHAFVNWWSLSGNKPEVCGDAPWHTYTRGFNRLAKPWQEVSKERRDSNPRPGVLEAGPPHAHHQVTSNSVLPLSYHPRQSRLITYRCLTITGNFLTLNTFNCFSYALFKTS